MKISLNRSFIYVLKTILFISFNTSSAQEIQWQNTIGGGGWDELYSIQQTSDGGYILGGRSNSSISGDKTENCIGILDFWIVKTDSLGGIQWQNTIGGSGWEELYAIQQTSDGGYIIGGISSSNISGDKTENSIGVDDYWIVKTDPLGSIQWQNTIGGNNWDELYSIQQTSDGGYILGGHSTSGISGDKTENNKGAYDYWIVKTDSLGDIQWQKTIGGSDADELYSIKQTTDGGYIIGGLSNSNISSDKSEDSEGGKDFWIVKSDSLGSIQWQNTIGGNSDDDLKYIQQTSDGGYILGGYSLSNISGDKTLNSKGGEDIWIVKTDSQGVIQWQNAFGGNDNDRLYSLAQTSDGGFILGGYSSSNFTFDKTENSNGLDDYWVIKTDSLGNIQWQNTIGGTNYDCLYSIQPTTDMGYILGGWSQSNISGDKTENSSGGLAYWIVKLTSNYNSITGSVYADFNSDNFQDAGEPVLPNKKITEQSTGRFDFSAQNGKYSVSVLDSSNFTISTSSINNYNLVPLNHNAYFSAIHQTDSLNDFAFQPQGSINDLCVTIIPLGDFSSGFNASYLISYGNYGTTTMLPTLHFFPYSNVTYSSASVTPFLVTSDSVVWNLPALSPLQTGNIVVTVAVDLGLPIGTLINSAVRIEPVAGDANPTCNSHTWPVFVTGSYDPNDILVNEDTLTTSQLSASPWLEYIIRFQNTGNDTALTIKILNPLDTNFLELSTIEFMNASHPVHLTWKPWERNMEFLFDNILLPDSNINEPLSHGFVRYKIKPKTSLTAGSAIANFAAIYFDFNAPIITNTAVTKIVLHTTLNEAVNIREQLVIYPNPATDEITISGYTLNSGPTRIKVMDVLGKEVYFIETSASEQKISTKYFPRGVYFVWCDNIILKFVTQ